MYDDFRRTGYAVVPGILDSTEILKLRKICAQRLTDDGAQEMCSSEFLTVPELARVPVNDLVVTALKELLGSDYRTYPNFIVRKSVYVPWHVDDAFTGPGGEYVWDPAFAHVQAAVYLQDNRAGAGGGIDVLPGSHLVSFDAYGRMPPDFVTATSVLESHGLASTVQANAGDLVLWHARLLHASTPVTAPSGQEKFGIFFSCGRNDPYASNRYLTHLLTKRIRVKDGIARYNPRFAEIADLRYPDSYPTWFVESHKKHGTAMATF